MRNVINAALNTVELYFGDHLDRIMPSRRRWVLLHREVTAMQAEYLQLCDRITDIKNQFDESSHLPDEDLNILVAHQHELWEASEELYELMDNKLNTLREMA